MQLRSNNLSGRREPDRTPGQQSSKHKVLRLGTYLLLAGLAVGILALLSPTTSASAASSQDNRGQLFVSPTSFDNLGTNRACNYDTRGNTIHMNCVITIKNTSNRNPVRWTASINNRSAQLSATSGRLFPNATVKIYLTENGLLCPDNSTITISGPFNTVRIPVICNDIVVTPDKNSFSSRNCNRDGRGNWTCMVRVSADPKDTEPVQWTTRVFGSSAVKVSPAFGTVSLERRGRVVIDRSQFVKITIPSSWGCRNTTIAFYAPGTPQVSRPQNTLTWYCRR